MIGSKVVHLSQTLQNSLQTKAKAELTFRFYSLWDKVWRPDVIEEAYRRCKANRGAAGVDDTTFEQIETNGRTEWLSTIVAAPAPASPELSDRPRRRVFTAKDKLRILDALDRVAGVPGAAGAILRASRTR